MAREYQTIRGFVNETGTRQYQSVGAFVNETVAVSDNPFALLDWPIAGQIKPRQKHEHPSPLTTLYAATITYRDAILSRPPNPLHPIVFYPPNLILGSLIKPFSQTSWPNPDGKRPIPQDFHDSLSTRTLLGQDKFFGAPGMGPNYQWPNPTVPKSRVDDTYGVNLQLNTLAVAEAQPFSMTDWDFQDRHPRLPVGLEPPPNLTITTLGLANDQPFAVTDFPNPTTYRQPAGGYVHELPSTLTTPTATVPFIVNAWDNPTRPLIPPIIFQQEVNDLPLHSRGFAFPSVNTVITNDSRLRRFADMTSEILNSLIRNGQLRQTGPKEWEIVP